MNRYISTIFHPLLLALALLMTGLISCKKVYEDTPLTFNEISSFVIPVEGNAVIEAAVSENELIVYWPSHLNMPEKIKPEISVSEQAVVSPATKEEIRFENGMKYTVKAQNGEERSYILRIVVNQPELVMTDESFTSFRAPAGGYTDFSLGGGLRNVIEDTQKTRVWVISASGVETELQKEFVVQGTASVMRVYIPATGLAIGAYKLKIISGIKTLATVNPIFGVVYPSTLLPKADVLTSDISIKRGAEVTFRGTNFAEMRNGRILQYTSTWAEKELGVLELVRSTPTSATYRIPANLPLREYRLNDSGAFEGGIFFQLKASEYFGNWVWYKPEQFGFIINGDVKVTVTD